MDVQGDKRVLFDVAKDGTKIAPKYVPPEDEQEPYESRRYVSSLHRFHDHFLTSLTSRIHHSSMLASYFLFSKTTHRLWSKLTTAIVAKDMERATEAKSAVEERERELRRLREESGQHHTQRFFAQNKDGRWIPKFTCVALLFFILPDLDKLYLGTTESQATPQKPSSRCSNGSGRPRPRATRRIPPRPSRSIHSTLSTP